MVLVDHDADLSHLRWTVDTRQDLTLVREIFTRLEDKMEFSWLDVLKIFENEPALAQINCAIQHKTAHDVDTRQ